MMTERARQRVGGGVEAAAVGLGERMRAGGWGLERQGKNSVEENRMQRWIFIGCGAFQWMLRRTFCFTLTESDLKQIKTVGQW